jgi:LacI family transcriptional regulator
MLMARPTLADIAKLAYSTAPTVSRVLRNEPGPSNATRTRVLAAARTLGYLGTPAGVIGLIIPDRRNPFFSGLGLIFQDLLERFGLQVVLGSSDGCAERELSLINRFRGMGLSGVLYIATGHASREVLSALETGNLPTVVLDRQVEAGKLDFVSVDNADGIRRAVDYLAAHGHRRIGFLKGLDGTTSAAARAKGFRDSLALDRLECRDEWVWEGDYRFGAGRLCAESLMAMTDRPTAVVAANDAMAIGLIQRLAEAGWALPHDLSITGFDNVDAAQWTYPALTTIDQRTELLARTAVDLLTARMRALDETPQAVRPSSHVIVTPTLVPRASVTSA